MSENDSACDVCNYVGEHNAAVLFCSQCSEALCQRCSAIHHSQNATKHHIQEEIDDTSDTKYDKLTVPKLLCVLFFIKTTITIIDNTFVMFLLCWLGFIIGTFFVDYVIMYRKDRYRRNCDPCKLIDKLIVRASSFCEDCDEYLCKMCTQDHRAQKASRDHQLQDTVEGIKQRLSMIPRLPCEICENDQGLRADAYCKTCDTMICYVCAEKHKRHNRTANNPNTKSNPGAKPCEIRRLVEIDYQVIDEVKAKAAAERPGKPVASSITVDSLYLTWKRSDIFNSTDFYQIRYRDVDGNGKFKYYKGEYDTTAATLTDLKADANIIFQVRVVHDDCTGPFGSESDIVTTPRSPATRIATLAPVVRLRKPTIYKLPLTEVSNARNYTARTKKLELGCIPPNGKKEKTIMLVGATGTGKSTLVDGMVNYILGIKWDDPFRFTTIDMENEDKERHLNQAHSQTDWITCYTINPEPGSRIQYRLNIIDTPGFGDTRGLKRDQQLVDQIRQLFLEKGCKGIHCIDSICFLVKAPDARLTAVQTYIFQAIMSLFANDVAANLTTLITFADGIEPPVIAALNESKHTFGKFFTFNNSALFTNNVDIENNNISNIFWEMGSNSFRNYFEHLNAMETISLYRSMQVLELRLELDITVESLQETVETGIECIHKLNAELKMFEEHKSDIVANKDYFDEVEESQQRRTALPKGQYVTNCLRCNLSCHRYCDYANDSDKKYCSCIGSNGYCKHCPGRCHWKQHATTPFIFENVVVKQKKTNASKKAMYDKLTRQTSVYWNRIGKLKTEYLDLNKTVELLTQTMDNCNARLKEIALIASSADIVEHIKLMIEAEKLDQKEGFQQRISILNEFRQKAEIDNRVSFFNQESRALRALLNI